MWKLRKTHIVAIYYSQALRIYTLWLPMTCEWDSQATSDCSYHMCEFFLFYTFPSNELFFTFTQEKIVPDAKSGSLMGSQSCWCSGKALKAVKLALKDCKTSFSLFSLLFFLLPRQVFFYTAFAADGEIFFNVRWKKSAIIETWNFLKAKKNKVTIKQVLAKPCVRFLCSSCCCCCCGTAAPKTSRLVKKDA